MARCVRSSISPQANPNLGPLLRATREDVGISRRALAALAGVNHSHLARFEHGERSVSPDFLVTVVTALATVLAAKSAA